VQTGIRDRYRRDISLDAIIRCSRLLQGLCAFAVEGSGVLLLMLFPIVAFVGCRTTEDALLARGNDLLNQQAYAEASFLFTSYIQLCPDAPQGYFARGIVYQETGNLVGAERDFENAILLNPSSTNYRWARYTILKRRYEALLSITTTDVDRPAWQTLKSALATLMMGDLRMILKVDPQDISARLELASVLRLRGSTDEAMTELDRSVLEAPFDPGARNERGKMLHEMGRYSDALEDYDMALRYCDNCTLVNYNRGLALRQCGRLEEAAAAFEEVLTEDSLDGGAWLNLGELQHSLGRSDKACQSLQRSMNLGIPEARDLYEELCR